MPVYLFWGEEDFNIDSSMKELREKVLDPNWVALSHKVLTEPDISLLNETLQTLPLSFGNILIEVYSSLFLRGGVKVSSSDKNVKKLIENIETVNEKVHLLFVCKIPRNTQKKIDSSLKLTKTLQKVGQVQEFPAIKAYKENDLIQWINRATLKKGIKISRDASLKLLMNTGSELRKIDSELEKLKLAIHPQTFIKQEDVLQLCANHENVFLFADLWLKGDKPKTLIELHKLLEKDHPVKIIAVLQTVIRRWIKIKLESQTNNAFEVSKTINLHKFLVENDIKKLKNISIDNLIRMRTNLTDAEYKIKSGKMDPVISMEVAISN